MDPMEVMISESQERMLAIVTPENLDEVLALCERWEIRAVGHRAGDHHRPVPGLRRVHSGGAPPSTPRASTAGATSCSPMSRPRASATARSTTGRSPARRTRTPSSPPTPARPWRSGSRPAPTSGRSCSGCCRCPTSATRRGSGASTTTSCSSTRSTGPGCDAAVLRLRETREGPGPHHRREGPVLPPRSPDRRGAGGPRGRPQRGLHRGPADGPGQLPQLRQSRAPRGDVAVRRGGGRDGRGLPGARPARHRRQRELLQRVRRRRHPPDAGGRRGRPDRPARRPAPPAALAARADGSSSSATPPPSSAVPSGRPAATASSAGCRRPPIWPPGPASTAWWRRWSPSGPWPASTTAPTGAWPSR